MTKAGDWQSYKRVLLPPVKDLHHLDVYRVGGGYEALRAVLSDWKPDEVTEEVKRSGLRGRGGAGFPTGLKWSFMPPVKPDVPRYLCCNADESEPGTFKDRQLMEYNPHLMFEGILIAGYAMSLKACYLYVRGEFANWITLLQDELSKLYDAKLAGSNILGTGFSLDIIMHKGAGAYICGEETSLMESLEGKRAYPRIKPPFPAQSGIWGYPTTINNVETLACAPLIINRGGDWFAGVGAKKHPGPVLYGISGHVNRPGVYEYPTGMLITDLLDIAGGIRGNKKLKALVPGGASVPVLRADMID
ncbi:MAG: NADH-quinone oxidoreductase subunit F, partial [Rhodothermaceae bacterium]|nr:NADH-quinone oxidoreductase subunit F [Rhodothermaceae bacterium]